MAGDGLPLTQPTAVEGGTDLAVRESTRGPSILFLGRNAQVAVNPWPGEIVTAYRTGSKPRKKVLRQPGLPE
jgi:hypothetical protein